MFLSLCDVVCFNLVCVPSVVERSTCLAPGSPSSVVWRCASRDRECLVCYGALCSLWFCARPALEVALADQVLGGMSIEMCSESHFWSGIAEFDFQVAPKIHFHGDSTVVGMLEDG